ncbi:hypothetical protein NSZ01_24600 [Nocardioides szechwanensis]|uniref:Patatin-like phospholipase n=1 Tax=Nocardioides szechwanensis TaxID=1005944 RepID=A0A1H0EEW5_9ACTN|nr:hypothetical protein [Nocardioides szechwanensis]GEP34692.1 hypothetical protein NSZ01_24600 [Nocardioides szechwanensis]SDN81037.1 hypothetical protein SAMN05192576_2841 [Nocardioides szechwanensis]
MPDRPAPLARIDAGLATLLSLAAALAIALRQLDGLVGQVLQDGTRWTPTDLTGLHWPETAHEGWRFLFGPADAAEHRLDAWLTGYVFLDVAFALTYGALLMRWVVHELARATTFGRAWAAVASGAAAVVAVAADLTEGVLILGRWETPLPFASYVKWAGLAVAVLVLVVMRGRDLVSGLRLGAGAFYTHRYSAIIVLPLALLGLVAGPDIVEQVPDIQRRWVDDGPWHVVAAAFVTAVLAGATFVVGRQRTDHLWRRTTVELPEEADPLSPLLLWFAGPVVLLVAGVAVQVGGGEVAWRRAGGFAAIPILVGFCSWVRRVRSSGSAARRPTRPKVTADRFRAASLVGDVLPGVLLVVTGLGAIRSFTAVVALGDDRWQALALMLIGVVTVAVTWPLYGWCLGRLADAADRNAATVLLTPGIDSPARSRTSRSASLASLKQHPVSWLALALSTLAGLLLALLPGWAAAGLGVIATFQLALGSLSILIASVVVITQRPGAPEAFWFTPRTLAFTPTTSLVVLACLATAVAGTGDDVHPVRDGPNDAGIGVRAGVPVLLDQWLAADPDGVCETELEGQRVRPLVMYAAEGGGIRAAYWTASGVDQIAALTPGPEVCGGAFVSSGASGGALGLAIASVRDPGDAREAVRQISGPDGLTEAVTGMVLRDTIFAATGIGLPSFGAEGRDDATWADRAALIEESWEEQIPELREPWLQARGSWSWGITGPLVLNSTSSTTGCRALVSQVALGEMTRSGCGEPTDVAGSSDLVACTGQLYTSTAALLASRFPFVTPAGSEECAGVDQQYVDGGYAENTGIGTLVDLAPQVLPWVRAHNDCVLMAGPDCGARPTTLVVPLLVYFDNGSGSDLAAPTPEPALEVLVPVATALKAKKSLYSTDSQLQRATAALATDQLWSVDGSDLVSRVDEWRAHSVFVVYQATSPGIAGPLGWVLSTASQRPMDDALADQRLVAKLSYGNIDELVRTLDPGR